MDLPGDSLDGYNMLALIFVEMKSYIGPSLWHTSEIVPIVPIMHPSQVGTPKREKP